MSSPLTCHALSHRFGDQPILGGLDLDVKAGHVVAVLGSSGCGKTTLLRAISGLLTPDGGMITVGGVVVCADGTSQVPPESRGVGLVFQDYALFPHMTVAENVGFGLKKGTADPRVAELLELAGLEAFASRYPRALSGGQQQRVALVRALAPKPHLILLDEPFSSVDKARREALGDTLRMLTKQQGTAALFVTHDRTDALRLADEVVALISGPDGARIHQKAPPDVVYHQPADAAVALLTGPASFIPATASGTSAETAIGVVPLREEMKGAVQLVVRPEQARFDTDPAGTDRVVQKRFLGRCWQLVCQTAAGEITTEHATCPDVETGRVVIAEPLWPIAARPLR